MVDSKSPLHVCGENYVDHLAIHEHASSLPLGILHQFHHHTIRHLCAKVLNIVVLC